MFDDLTEDLNGACMEEFGRLAVPLSDAPEAREVQAIHDGKCMEASLETVSGVSSAVPRIHAQVSGLRIRSAETGDRIRGRGRAVGALPR